MQDCNEWINENGYEKKPEENSNETPYHYKQEKEICRREAAESERQAYLSDSYDNEWSNFCQMKADLLTEIADRYEKLKELYRHIPHAEKDSFFDWCEAQGIDTKEGGFSGEMTVQMTDKGPEFMVTEPFMDDCTRDREHLNNGSEK